MGRSLPATAEPAAGQGRRRWGGVEGGLGAADCGWMWVTADAATTAADVAAKAAEALSTLPAGCVTARRPLLLLCVTGRRFRSLREVVGRFAPSKVNAQRMQLMLRMQRIRRVAVRAWKYDRVSA